MWLRKLNEMIGISKSLHLQEFMRGGGALDNLISDVLENEEKQALLELVENRGNGRDLTNPD